ncbi:MAG: DUF222 domain-containing protein, partial [Nocardioides sp.]
MAVATSFELPPGSPTGVVETALDMLDELDQVLWSAKTPSELLGANVALEAVRSRVAAVQARVAAEIDATDAAKVEGWASVPDYLTATSGGRQGWGNRLLRTARALASDRHATHSALHSGDVSPEHAEVIVKVINLLPVDTGLRGEAERFLLAEARHLNATDLQAAGDHLLEVLDPDGLARREERNLDKHERSAHLNRTLSIIDDGLGGVKLRGRGTTEDAAVIR